MYAALIGSAMDPTSARNVHPAFTDALRQMLPVEARLFAAIYAFDPVIVKGTAGARYELRTTYPTGGYSQTIGLESLPSEAHTWRDVWQSFNIELASEGEVYDALSNLERLGLLRQQHVTAIDQVDREEAMLPPLHSILDWSRKLEEFKASRPTQAVPPPEADVGDEIFEFMGGHVIAKRNAAIEIQSREFVIVEHCDILIARTTRWGRMFGGACHVLDFIGDGEIRLPTWAE